MLFRLNRKLKLFLFPVLVFFVLVSIVIYMSSCSCAPQENNKHDNTDTNSEQNNVKRQPSLDDGGIVYYVNSDNSLSINLLNPDTGTSENIRSFQKGSNKSYTLDFYGGSSPLYNREYFTPDYSKTVASKSKAESDGSKHIGFVDNNGNFTDVTEKIVTKSDFGGVTKQSCPRFDMNGEYLYFVSECSSNNGFNGIFRVPLNNISKDKVEEIKDKDSKFQGNFSYIQPDGSVVGVSSSIPYIASDKTMTYYGPHFGVGTLAAWSKSNTYVAISSDGLMSLCKGGSKDDVSSVSLSKDKYFIKSLTPQVSTRVCGSPVFSPDESTVAFISFSTEGSEPANLYKVSINGGDPVKINTTYSFINAHVNSQSSSNSGNHSSDGLLEWREKK